MRQRTTVRFPTYETPTVYRPRTPTIHSFNAGMSVFDVSQTARKSTAKYACAIRFRMPMMSCQGISGIPF